MYVVLGLKIFKYHLDRLMLITSGKYYEPGIFLKTVS